MTGSAVTVTQAAVRLGVSERTVRRRIASGKLRTVQDAGAGRGPLVDLDIAGQVSETAADREIATLRELVDVLKDQLRQSQLREGAMLDAIRQAALPAPATSRPWWKLW